MGLAERAAKAIEEAFDENVKGLAMAKWAVLSGKASTIEEAMKDFGASLKMLTDLRKRELAEAAKVFGESP